MALLIQLRQRIKAIETIKKMTHAMRLISMSSHSRLKGKEHDLQHYKNELGALFHTLKTMVPQWENPILYPDESPTSNPLIILVGSQKGLCGNFNSALFQLLEKRHEQKKVQLTQVITVGKKAVDYAQEKMTNAVVESYSNFSYSNLLDVAKQINTQLTQAKKPYSSVIVFSNVLKTFFLQKPVSTQLIPFNHATGEVNEDLKEDLIWEQSADELLDFLSAQYLEATIQHLLFQSLLAEHAARFLSMDNSTRNAKGLLETTRMQYNKLRQTKITKEVTELSGQF